MMVHQNSTKSRIAIVSLCYGELRYATFSQMINRAYCERHGYNFIVFGQLTDSSRHANWSKVRAVGDVLNRLEHDYVAFLDADAWYYDHERTMEALIAEHMESNTLMLFGTDRRDKEVTWCDSNANAGVFVVKNTPLSRHIMEEWWHVAVYDRHTRFEWPVEQRAFNNYIRQRWDGEARIKVIPYHFLNGRDGYFIRHAVGESDDVRLTLLKDEYYRLCVRDNSEPQSFRTLAYRRTGNLGDAIQSVAISRLLRGGLKGAYRDAVNSDEDYGPLVTNGWLGDSVGSENTCFAGIHIARNIEQITNWVSRSRYPVGARDPHTQIHLNKVGVKAEMIGCSTLTFPRYSGKREGRYLVDVRPTNELERYISLTNFIPHDLEWRDQWNLALARLDLLRRAELIVTNRLHVILPCLAFGTPVLARRQEVDSTPQPERFSLLEDIGFEFGTIVTMDVSQYSNRYKLFLAKALEIDIMERDPVFPETPSYYNQIT